MSGGSTRETQERFHQAIDPSAASEAGAVAGAGEGDPDAEREGDTRRGWSDAFREMAARGDDRLIDPEASAWPEWDDAGWRWD
jgi:hypothetical protein